MPVTSRAATRSFAALLLCATAVVAQEQPPNLELPPPEGKPLLMPLPDVEPGLPSLDEIDLAMISEKSLCVFPFIQAEAGNSDAKSSKYQESLQQVFYDVAKASPVLKNPLFLKRPPACGYRDTACIAGIGGFSHCENVLVGSSTPVDNGFLLSVRLIDVAKQKATARVDEVVVADKQEQIAAWAEGHACRALKVDCKGTVVLDLDLPDMVAVVDRRPVPRRPSVTGGPEKITLPAGLHTVRVSIGRRSSLERPLVIRRNGPPARISARQLSDCAIPVTVGGELKNEVAQSPSVECRGANVPKILGLTLAGAGVIAGGIGAFEGIQSKSGSSDVNSHVKSNGGVAVPNDLTKMESARTQAKTANILFIAGAVLIAGGAVLYFVFGGDK